MAFLLDCSIFEGTERALTHNTYHDLFSETSIDVVTAYQGYRKWHIARKFSMTSTTTHALIKALMRHNMDLEHHFIRVVCEFMCSNYDYDERVRKRALKQQRAAEELQQAEDVSNLQSAFDKMYSNEYIIENGIPDMVE